MIWVLCLTTLALFGELWAEPQQWASEGVAVAVSKPIEEVATATNDAGFTLNVWFQSQGAEPVIMGQLLAPGGGRLWETEGRLLAQGPLRAGYPTVTAVEDGWIIAWLDAEYVMWCDRLDGGWCVRSAIRAIKVDNTGAPLWASGRSGIEVVPMADFWDIHPFNLHSSGAGAIVTWKNAEDHILRARGVDTNGAMWPQAVETSPNLMMANTSVFSDDLGGVIVAWTQGYQRDSTIHANRILPDGTLAWGGTEGLLVFNAHDTLSAIDVCADGTGGAYLGWRFNSVSNSFTLLRLSSTGALVWPDDGVQICDLGTQRYVDGITPSYLSGTPDGVIVTIQQYGLGDHIYLQKVSPDGATMWGECGVEVCPGVYGESYILRSVTISDQSGGAVFYGDMQVSDPDGGHHELKVSRVAADGELAWAEPCATAGVTSFNSVALLLPAISDVMIRAQWFEQSNSSVLLSNVVDLASGGVPNEDPITVIEAEISYVRDQVGVKLANGATAIAWIKDGQSLDEARFQILDVFGTPRYSDQGQALITSGDDEPIFSRSVAICEDGSGGFFAVVNAVIDNVEQLRVVHLNLDGEHLANPQGMQPFGIRPGIEGTLLNCTPDGSGGCFVSATIYNDDWVTSSATMRVNAQCEPMWTQVVMFSEPNQDVNTVGIARDQNNSCLVLYSMLVAYPEYSLHLARIGATGETEFNISIAQAQLTPNSAVSLSSNSQSGAYIVWAESEGTFSQLKAQHVSQSGLFVWGNDGITLVDSSMGIANVQSKSDNPGNLIIAWNEWINGGSGLLVQRISPDGIELWQAGGLVLCDSANFSTSPILEVLSDNEIYIAWLDYRVDQSYLYAPNVYATHLNARGEIHGDSYWQECGNQVCEASFNQWQPIMISDGVGGVVLSWIDQRTGIGNWSSSLFSQRLYDPLFTNIEEKPVLPTEFSLMQNYPNPFNPETTIEFSLTSASLTTMKVFDVTGREVTTLVNGPLTSGHHQVSFDASLLSSGVYFYALRANKSSLTRKMVLLK
ncbi:MAG: T9SS type A sorting domain-containing protein [bacterium]|nr:T9SS type A sorting domain-containing protein [bacterium]